MAMKTGEFWWYDDGEDPLADRVARAAKRYRAKFAADPTHCAVHPSAIDGESVEVGKIKVVARPTVLRRHFALWREENEGGDGEEDRYV